MNFRHTRIGWPPLWKFRGGGFRFERKAGELLAGMEMAKNRYSSGDSLASLGITGKQSSRTKLALRLEETIAARAKSNVVEGGRAGGKGLQNSVNPSKTIHTSEELGKLAGVSRDTVDKVKAIERKATPEVKEALAGTPA